MIFSFFSFLWGLLFRYILGILCTVFSIVIIALLIGVVNIDQVTSFLNLGDVASAEIKEFYQKFSEAVKNSFTIITDIFSFSDKDSTINKK